jgi:membrane fusion protein, multidrug efflux system
VLGPVVQGLRIVRSGLAPSDRVVIEGMQGAVPGSKVDAHAGRVAPDATAPDTDDSAPIAAQATFTR